MFSDPTHGIQEQSPQEDGWQAENGGIGNHLGSEVSVCIHSHRHGIAGHRGRSSKQDHQCAQPLTSETTENGCRQDQNRQDQQNQGQQPKITPQAAQQMLQAIQAKEKETQDKVNKQKAEALKSRQKEKNW